MIILALKKCLTTHAHLHSSLMLFSGPQPAVLSDQPLQKTARLQHGASSLMSATTGSLSSAAATLVSHQKKREAHCPPLLSRTNSLPVTPSKQPLSATSTSGKSALYSPKSFYKKGELSSGDIAKGKGNPFTKGKTQAGTASKMEKRKAHEPTAVSCFSQVLVEGKYDINTDLSVKSCYVFLFG